MACHSQRGFPLLPTNDHISSISASPACSMCTATCSGFSVRSSAVFTDSSTTSFFLSSRNDARMPHCLRWGGMASLLGGLGDRFPQHDRDLPSKAPPLAAGIFTFGIICPIPELFVTRNTLRKLRQESRERLCLPCR